MRILGLFLALLVAALPLTAHADDASALLAKHRAFVGWQFDDGTFSSMVIEGKMTYLKDGATKTAYTLHGVRLGIASRFTETGANGTTEDSGFTGRLFWATNRNGFTYPRLGDAQKFGIAEGIVFNELASGLGGKSLGTKILDGREYGVVRVSLPQSDAVDLYVDPTTPSSTAYGGIFCSTRVRVRSCSTQVLRAARTSKNFARAPVGASAAQRRRA